MQAEYQCCGSWEKSIKCIVVSKLEGILTTWTGVDSRGSGGPVPPGWWFSAGGQPIGGPDHSLDLLIRLRCPQFQSSTSDTAAHSDRKSTRLNSSHLGISY